MSGVQKKVGVSESGNHHRDWKKGVCLCAGDWLPITLSACVVESSRVCVLARKDSYRDGARGWLAGGESDQDKGLYCHESHTNKTQLDTGAQPLR